MRAKIFVILEVGMAALVFSNCLFSKYKPKNKYTKDEKTKSTNDDADANHILRISPTHHRQT